LENGAERLYDARAAVKPAAFEAELRLEPVGR
jgi:hypothetical protein